MLPYTAWPSWMAWFLALLVFVILGGALKKNHWDHLRKKAVSFTLPEETERVVFLADSHIGARGSSAQDFSKSLEKLPKAEVLVLLGDIFHLWFAPKRYWTTTVRDSIKALEKLRQEGVQIVFVLGNRDYLLPKRKHPSLPFAYLVEDMGKMGWGDKTYGVIHGDTINRKDKSHLLWRAFSRLFLVKFFIQLLPKKWFIQLCWKTEKKMTYHSVKMKQGLPMDDMELFAQKSLLGLEGCFMGHFHMDKKLSFGENKPWVRIVPDWHEKKQALLLNKKGETEMLQL